jgi:nicotinate dehydrogenase subunit A
MATTIKLTVNGTARVLEVDDPEMPLLYALRDQLGLHGMHFGCGLAQCGACTVHYYGEALRSCVMPISAVAGAEIVTLEGLGTPEKPHPLQQAFIDEQAAQCGYCINGMIMSAAALLERNKFPSEAEIREALAGNLCRCGTHQRIVAAIKRAAVA